MNSTPTKEDNTAKTIINPFPELIYSGIYKSMLHLLKHEGIEEFLDAERHSDGLVQRILKISRHTYKTKQGENELTVDVVRNSNINHLANATLSLKELQKLMPESGFEAFSEHYCRFLCFLLFDDTELRNLDYIMGQHDKLSKEIEDLTKNSNGKIYGIDAYKKSKERKQREIDALQNKINLYENILNGAFGYYMRSHSLLNIATASFVVGFKSSENDFETAFDAVLDLLESLYLPFEAAKNLTYQHKMLYWQTLDRLRSAEGWSAEQINNFACAVKQNLEDGLDFKKAHSSALANPRPRDRSYDYTVLVKPEGGAEC